MVCVYGSKLPCSIALCHRPFRETLSGVSFAHPEFGSSLIRPNNVWHFCLQRLLFTYIVNKLIIS